MIPELDPATKRLPYHSLSGGSTYQSTIPEIQSRFALEDNDRRCELWHMFELWVQQLRSEAARYLDAPGSLRIAGSYVTDKSLPNDIVAAARSAEDSKAPGNKWPYRSAVVFNDSCPNRYCNVNKSMPAPNINDA